MRACISIVFALILVPLASQGGEKTENPYKTAKVGDYLSYRVNTSISGKAVEITMKQSVTDKSDTEVTVKTATTIMNKELPAQTNKIDLTKPFDFVASMAGKKKAKFEKTAEGKEKIKVGDKTYESNWLSGRVTAEAKGMQVESEVKVWFTKAVPMSGIIKMEMKSDLATMQMELTGSGNEK